MTDKKESHINAVHIVGITLNIDILKLKKQNSFKNTNNHLHIIIKFQQSLRMIGPN